MSTEPSSSPSSESNSSHSDLPPEAPRAVNPLETGAIGLPLDPERALIVHAIQTHASKALADMTPDQVVDSVIALALVPQPPELATPDVPAPVAAPAAAPVPTAIADLSPDPLLANNELRRLIGQEIARLQHLAASPGVLTSEHLFTGPLFA